MTEQVAIKRLQDHFEVHDDGRPTPFLDEAVSMAINALEKQIAKKVNLYIGNDMSCPTCGHRLRGYEGIRNPYCKYCGQQLER